MPPQQSQGLLDFAHNGRNFRAHDLTGSREKSDARCSDPDGIAQGMRCQEDFMERRRACIIPAWMLVARITLP
jgi:hypothetical protein